MKVNRRTAIQHMALAGTGTLLSGCGTGKTVRRPNIIFIMTDDQTVDQMSCYGHSCTAHSEYGPSR